MVQRLCGVPPPLWTVDRFLGAKRETSLVSTTRNVPKLDRRIPYEKPRDFGTIQQKNTAAWTTAQMSRRRNIGTSDPYLEWESVPEYTRRGSRVGIQTPDEVIGRDTSPSGFDPVLGPYGIDYLTDLSGHLIRAIPFDAGSFGGLISLTSGYNTARCMKRFFAVLSEGIWSGSSLYWPTIRWARGESDPPSPWNRHTSRPSTRSTAIRSTNSSFSTSGKARMESCSLVICPL